MENFYLIPLFAVVANIGCLLPNVGKDHPFHRLILIFYASAIVFNITTAILCISDSPGFSRAIWAYAMVPAWFLIPVLLVSMVSFASGRGIVNRFSIFMGVSVLPALFAIFISPASFLVSFHKTSFAILSLEMSAMGSFLGGYSQFIGIALSLYLILRPIRWVSFFSRKLFIIAILLWWLPMLSNILATAGFDIPPPHSLADAVMSVMFSIYLNRRSIGVSPIISLVSNILISLSISVILGIIAWEVLPTHSGKEVVVISVVALFACIFASLLNVKGLASGESHGNDMDASLREFKLSKQELRICELIFEGHSRAFIQLVLNISEGTLRNHLKNIYAKVLPKRKDQSKDQLQRLTVLISKKVDGGRRNLPREAEKMAIDVSNN